MVPDPPAKKTKAGAGVPLQSNGLPEGVKILPVAAPVDQSTLPPLPPEPIIEPEATTEAEPTPAGYTPIIKSRARIRTDDESTDDESPEPDGAEGSPVTNASGDDPKPKRRKPGRPKAGRLDTPKSIGMNAPAATLPSAPRLAAVTAPEAYAMPESTAPAPSLAPPGGPKHMSDISPRRPHPTPPAEPEPKGKKSKKAPKPPKAPKVKREHVHKVGVPPLHYGAVLAFSLRARVRPRLLGLAALAAISFAAAAAYGAWVVAHDGLPALSHLVQAQGPKVLGEVALLAVLYYIGRSVGQAAIIYGVARESDHRPIPMSRQLGVGINTFGRRLALDLGFALLELVLLGLIVALVLTGGQAWPVDIQIQMTAIFTVFLVLLYLHTSLGITRGLAGVILTLTTHRVRTAARLAWRLYSHRFELLGLRFFGAALELVLAVPLAAVAAAFIAAAPAQFSLGVALGVGLLALVAGALFGVGTATWWAGLYRRLILVDAPDTAMTMLSGRQPQDARRTPLTLIVSLSTLVLAAILALPWLRW